MFLAVVSVNEAGAVATADGSYASEVMVALSFESGGVCLECNRCKTGSRALGEKQSKRITLLRMFGKLLTTP